MWNVGMPEKTLLFFVGMELLGLNLNVITYTAVIC